MQWMYLLRQVCDSADKSNKHTGIAVRYDILACVPMLTAQSNPRPPREFIRGPPCALCRKPGNQRKV